MKRALVLAILVLSSVSLPAQAPTPAPAGPTAEDVGQLAALVREVKAQQAVIGQNQEKIDAQLATLGDLIRYARIYASRSGK